MISETLASGVGVYVMQLCNDLCDAFDVYLAYSLNRMGTPKNYKQILDRRIHLIEVKNFGKNLMNIKDDRRAIRELKELQRQIQPDIIHLHSSIAGGFGRLAYMKLKIPIVYTPHGYAHILMGSGQKSNVYRMLEKILGKTNHITLTCCESEDEEAKKLCKRTAYIETGINVRELASLLDGIQATNNAQFTVFTLGRICRQKRPDLFNRIAELVPDARFVWIGDGELRDKLTAHNIEVTGWKPRHEALSIAKGADAFVLCSYGEAIAMSLLENMYIKKLCLVSNTMGNKSVIHDGINGYLCNKPEEYAEKIRSAMNRFPLELTEAAYADVQNIYNTVVMKEKYLKFYEGLVKSPS